MDDLGNYECAICEAEIERPTVLVVDGETLHCCDRCARLLGDEPTPAAVDLLIERFA